jgi:TonB-dependent starch-binding outer membrane protein SusC
LLMVIQIPGYTGYSNQMQNTGQTRNIGLELSLGGDIINTHDLKVSADFNIAFNRGIVQSLSQDMDHYYYGTGWASNSTRPASGDYALIVGKPVGLIRGFVYDGYYTTNDFTYDPVTHNYTLKDGVANSRTVLGLIPGVQAGAYPGMAKFKKLASVQSGTEVNETDDVTIIGNPNPKHTGGFNINSTFKGFDLLLSFNWSYGNDVYNTQKLADSFGNKLPFRNFSAVSNNWYHLFKIDASGNLVRVYTPTGLDSLNVNTTTQYPFNEMGVSNSSGIEDGSFLRLNNVTLGYSLPSDLTKKVAIQHLRIYGTIYNALLWTKYTGFDPEVSTRDTGTYPTPGIDFGSYPRSRSFTIGVNVTF